MKKKGKEFRNLCLSFCIRKSACLHFGAANIEHATLTIYRCSSTYLKTTALAQIHHIGFEQLSESSTGQINQRQISPPYKSKKLAKSCTSVATSAEQAELFRVVREGHSIPESTCCISPIVMQPVEKRPFSSSGKRHVFLWKLALAQEKD